MQGVKSMVSGKVYTLDEAKFLLGDALFSAWLGNAKKLTSESDEELTEKILKDFDNTLVEIRKIFDTINLSPPYSAEDSRPEEAYR